MECCWSTRTVPLSCGNKPGTNRKAKPKRKPGDRYDSHAFGAAINRAIKIANRERLKVDPSAELLPNWHPNQLRHLVATEIRRQFGLEAAQVALGHSRADVTQVYAERDMTKAAAVIRMIG
jgi:integrase